MQYKHRNVGDGSRPGASFGRHQRRGGGGFHRGYSKLHDRPATKLEILMEAGRLAAEYLVSKGVFPSSALPRDLVIDNTPHEFTGSGRENPSPSSFNDSRVPAMDGLGDAGSAAGYARKRFNDDYVRFGPRKNARARGTTGSYNRGYGGPDWGRERARHKPRLERNRSYSDMVEEEDDDFLGPRYHKGRQNGHEEVGSSRVVEVVGETVSKLEDSHIQHNVNSECEMPVSLSEDDIQSSKQSIESQCDIQQRLSCSKISLTAVGAGEDDKVTEQTGKGELNKQVSSPPPNTSQQNEFSHSSLLIEMPSQDEDIIKPSCQLKPITAPSISIVEAETILKIDGVKCNQPTSFKICDLNLMEAPDVPENHMLGASHTSALPQASGKQLSVDFSLSRNNRINNTYDFKQLSGDRRAIQVIDLEEDSPMEVNDLLKSKNEIIYPVDNVRNHTAHSDDLPVVQDTYGLAISDYLGADMTCSPQDQAELNNLQVGMGLHGAEGFAVVDDSIYGSLGDIGFIDVWDQPPQDYEKFF